MKKAFFKYFISIFSITVVILLLQSAILIVQYSISQEKWKTTAFNDFVASLENTIENGQFEDFGLGSLRIVMSSLNDSRVSGYVVRDINGSTMFTFGKTADGRILATLLPSNQKNASTSEKVLSTSSRKNSVRLNVSIEEDSSYNSSVTVEKQAPYSIHQTLLVLPNEIKADDVAGSITLSFEGQDLFIIDLLTYSPRTYAYSKDVLNSCLRAMVISVPICLVIALCSAWIISSRNIQFIDSVRNALKKLAKGESDVQIKKNRNSELNEISIAIEDLDKELQKNAISRRAWLRSISHDLNTPATAIKMIVDGIGDGIFPLDETSVDQLKSETNILNERIGKVIDFSSLQANSTPVFENTSVLCLENNIKNGLSYLRDGSKTITFEHDCNEIICDNLLMSKACIELIKNAFEYGTDPNSIVLHVGKTADGNFFIYVENKGTLSKEIEGESFLEPWIKGDWSRTANSGSGLGLPIVCTIARLHKGTVSLANVDGEKVRATISWSSKN